MSVEFNTQVTNVENLLNSFEMEKDPQKKSELLTKISSALELLGRVTTEADKAKFASLIGRFATSVDSFRTELADLSRLTDDQKRNIQ